MGAVAIAGVTVVEAWAPNKDATSRAELVRAIKAASDWIEGQIGRRVVAPAADVVELYDGTGQWVRGRRREHLYLRQTPAIAITTVRENGITLTTAQGYTTTADVVIRLGDRRDSSRLTRRATFPGTSAVPRTRVLPGWAEGTQNLEITYRGGFDKAAVPEDLQQLCAEVAWAMHKLPLKAGRSSQSRRGSSTTFTSTMLSPIGLSILQSYRRFR